MRPAISLFAVSPHLPLRALLVAAAPLILLAPHAAAQDREIVPACEVNASGNSGSLGRHLRDMALSADRADQQRRTSLGLAVVADSEYVVVRDESVCRRAAQLWSSHFKPNEKSSAVAAPLPVVVIRVRDRYFVQCLHGALKTGFWTLVAGPRLDRVIAKVRG